MSPGPTPTCEPMSLSDVLAPMSVAEFREAHWNKAAAVLPRRASRFAKLAFDFLELRRGMQLGRDAEVKAQYFDKAGTHREIVGLAPSQIDGFFRAGMTICVTKLEPFLPDLAVQVEAWRRSLRFAGRMNFSCYWSPDGAGFGMHYDDRHVFICQIEGSKRWWFSKRPALTDPQSCLLYEPGLLAEMRAAGLEIAEPSEESLASAVLEPGDMLYLPAGTWHKTSAVGESLALTLRAFDATPSHIVETCLDRWFTNDDRWRRPLLIVDYAETPDASTPEPIARELSERLAALKTFVAGLSLTDLARAWAAAQVGEAPVALAPFNRCGDCARRQARLEERRPRGTCSRRGRGGLLLRSDRAGRARTRGA